MMIMSNERNIAIWLVIGAILDRIAVVFRFDPVIWVFVFIGGILFCFWICCFGRLYKDMVFKW